MMGYYQLKNKHVGKTVPWQPYTLGVCIIHAMYGDSTTSCAWPLTRGSPGRAIPTRPGGLAQVHLLEIDLLRRGTRAWTHPSLPDVPYLVLFTRAQASAVEVWPITLQEKLPTLPVPLRAPDPEAILDLSAALRTIYDDAFYHLSIDYTQDPPPPPFSKEETAWLRAQLQDSIFAAS